MKQGAQIANTHGSWSSKNKAERLSSHETFGSQSQPSQQYIVANLNSNRASTAQNGCTTARIPLRGNSINASNSKYVQECSPADSFVNNLLMRA